MPPCCPCAVLVALALFVLPLRRPCRPSRWLALVEPPAFFCDCTAGENPPAVGSRDKDKDNASSRPGKEDEEDQEEKNEEEQENSMLFLYQAKFNYI